MKPRLACLLTTLLSTLVLAQSNAAHLVREPVPPNLSQLLRGSHSPKQASTIKATGPQTAASGLIAAPVVSYAQE